MRKNYRSSEVIRVERDLQTAASVLENLKKMEAERF